MGTTVKRFAVAAGMMAAALFTATAGATSLTWNQTGGYAGTWDTNNTANWTWSGGASKFQTGDTAFFGTFFALGYITPGRSDSHYGSRTVTVDAGGVAPASITFNPAEINYLHLAGGDITGCAGGITLDSTWVADQAQLWFDRPTSYSFTGGVTVEEGCHVYYKPTAAGTYSLGTGTVHVKDVQNANATTFNYEPTVIGTTLTNTIHVQSGTTTFNWGMAPTFTGALNLDGNIHFNSVGGGYEYFDWNGNVNLSDNRTIIGGVRDLTARPAGGGLHWGGQFVGPTRTLTLDFQGAVGGAGLGMQAMLDTTAWNVGNLILTNGFGSPYFGSGNTPNLLVYTTNATDDHFATLRANGGKATIQNNAMLMLRKGTIDFADLQGDATGKVLFDMTNAAYDVRLSGSGMVLSSAAGKVQSAVIGNSTGATGQLRGDITVGSGGTLTLTGQYNEMVKQYVNPAIANSGNLTLLGGSTLNNQWGVGITALQLSSCYEFQSGAQKLYLGDGNIGTQETITLKGLESYTTSATATGTFFFGTDTANIVDDGNVILRYESTSGTGDFNIGWSTLANITAMGYNSGTISYPFRGGSAGTEFAPLNNSNTIGAIGPSSGTVFTATSPTRIVTAGTMGFFNSLSVSPTGHRGAPGAVVLNSGGTLELVAGSTVQASTIAVNSGASIKGSGWIDAAVTMASNATLAPGNSAGTLTVTNLTLQNGAIYQWEMDRTYTLYDALVVTGALVLPTSMTFDLRNLGDAATAGNSFVLFSYTGADPTPMLSGNVTFLTSNTIYPINATGASLVYDNVGNRVLLTGITAVPEPGALALLLLGAGLSLRRRRSGR